MPIIDFKIEDWLPMPPDMGPPLPRHLGIYWPFYAPPEPELGERKWINDVLQEYCGMGIWMPVSIGNLAECQAAGGRYIINSECRR